MVKGSTKGSVFTCDVRHLDFLSLPFLDGELLRFPREEVAELGGSSRVGFTADANVNGQAHCLLMQRVVPWFFMGHCGPSSEHWAGGGGDCIDWSGYRWGLQDILLPGWQICQHFPDRGQGLVAIDNVLMDLAEPHFSEVKIVPVGLLPS